MSNFIPILSSSPPPIDDTPSFDDDWDNDFGGFQSAGAGSFPATPAGFPEEQGFKPIHAPEAGPERKSQKEGEWASFSADSGPAPPPVIDADFVAFPVNGSQPTLDHVDANGDGTVIEHEEQSGKDGRLARPEKTFNDCVDSRHQNSEMDLPLTSTLERTAAHGDGRKSPRSSSSSNGSQEDRHVTTGEDFPTRTHEAKLSRPDTQDNTSQDSVTDSGLCSDISPVPKFEEYPDFGDSKSVEVEFCDEGLSRVSTIVEQDEGFANFTATDSCSSDKQSPDRDSGDFKLGLVQTNLKEPEPLNLKPATCSVEQEALDDAMEEESFGQFSCGSGEGTVTGTVPDMESEALTPTQSQYDTDNLASGSSSPNRPQDRQTPENDLGQFHLSNAGTKGSDTTVEAGSTPDTLEGQVPGTNSSDPTSSADCNDFSDFQSTDSQADNGSFHDCVADAALNPCDTQKAEPAVLGSVCQVPTNAQTEATFHGADMVETSGEQLPTYENPDSDSEAEFRDASEGNQTESSSSYSSMAAAQGDPSAKSALADTSGACATGHTSVGEEEEDEFGEFASETKPCISHDDGWTGGSNENDWAFQDSTNTKPDEDEADFDDFVSTESPASFAAFGEPVVSGRGEDNWASFAEPAAVAPLPEDDERLEEFSDFAKVAGTTERFARTVSETVSQTKSKKALGGEPVSEVVTRSFRLVESLSDSTGVDLLYKHMTEHIMRKEQTQQKQPGRASSTKSTFVDMSVWNNLRDLEKTAALKYTWDKSTNNKCLLHALSIDTRNILLGHKKTSVPIFAANLGAGVLEPSRGLPEAGREGRVSEVHTVDTNIKLTAITPQDIPPVEFDWSSAGLTNPLDSSNIQLDLDFFVTKTAWSGHSANTATSPTAALENELLKAIEPMESKQLRALEPLENYLANLKVIPTAPTINHDFETEQLSDTASEIVARFPILSFMRAKMLMFPVKGTGD